MSLIDNMTTGPYYDTKAKCFSKTAKGTKNYLLVMTA